MILIRVFIILQKKKKSINDNFHSNVHNKTIRPSSKKFVMLLYQNNIKKNIKTIFIFDKFYSTKKLWKYQNKNLQTVHVGLYSVSWSI